MLPGYGGGVLRTALRPRWLALLIVVLVAATAMAWLGQWQLDRARQRSAEQSAGERVSPRPLPDVLRARQTFPGDAVGQRVLAQGTWDTPRQVLVPGHELGGRTGYWVLTPLRLTDGSAVGVVRGWVADPAGAPAPVEHVGTGVEVVGRLQPTEPPAQRAPGQASGLPAGQIERIAAPELIGRWPYPLLTGYLVLESQDPPAGAGAPAPIPEPPPQQGLAWRNVSYALQWWAFAAFGVFLWWRMVRDDHEGPRRRSSGPVTGPAGPAGTEPPPREARPEAQQEGRVGDPTR